jgi:hypothetical protein
MPSGMMRFSARLLSESFVMTFLVISERHCLRTKAERFIREVYEQKYGARIAGFPRVLLGAIDSKGEILCAAGFRDCQDGFFSECYLDRPIEATLTQLSGQSVTRDRIFEVSTFASRSPNSIPPFVGDAIKYADSLGCEWGFFTLTRRLRQLFNRMGLNLSLLGSADAARIEDALAWGSYYEKDPKVYAGNGDSLEPHFAARRRYVANA